MNYEKLFDGSVVVITGGTGSFGHEAVTALLKYNVSEITLITNDEEQIFAMSNEFKFNDTRIKYKVGDVRDKERMLELIHGNIVYHAAALKIIPFCEANPIEATKTNFLGSMNVRDACIANHVERAVFISTDKCVKPVNAYGMGKALGERAWLAESNSDCSFTVVRYGNVLGSRGSLLPVCRALIRAKKPITITHPSMTRFVLTLNEAINLVFSATLYGAGNIYVRESPACQVVDFIKALAGPDYPTINIGIRPGEKMHEILVSEEEVRRTEHSETLFVIHPYGTYKSEMADEFASNNAHRMSIEELCEVIENCKL